MGGGVMYRRILVFLIVREVTGPGTIKNAKESGLDILRHDVLKGGKHGGLLRPHITMARASKIL